jgi:hypothetical protein
MVGMNIIRHEPLKMRHEYEREYRSDGTTRCVKVGRKDIEELFDMKEIWRTTKWLTEQTEHGCARFDFTVYCMATKIAKRVLLNEELHQVENESTGLFKTKPRELLSDCTYEALRKYVFKCWKVYEKFNMLTFTKVKYTKSFGWGRRRRSYTYRETAVKLTEKGKGVEV